PRLSGPIAEGHRGIHADPNAARFGGEHIPLLPDSAEIHVAGGDLPHQRPRPVLERLRPEENGDDVQNDERVDETAIVRNGSFGHVETVGRVTLPGSQAIQAIVLWVSFTTYIAKLFVVVPVGPPARPARPATAAAGAARPAAAALSATGPSDAAANVPARSTAGLTARTAAGATRATA